MTPGESFNVVRGALRAGAVERKSESAPGPSGMCRVITISRQAGIDGGAVVRRVAEVLNQRAPKDPNPWQSYDRQLIEQVAKEHDLPEDLVASHDEHDESVMEYALHGLSSRKPTEALAIKVATTIRQLAETGHRIIVGRGAQFILANRPGALHVRLIAPETWRAAAHAHDDQMSVTEATKVVRHIDAERTRYVKTHCHRDPTDPTAYHLILNLAGLTREAVANAIAAVALTPVPGRGEPSAPTE